mmetsp:Transcript_1229/g.3424  ORF Transcript_1229/g.3424 Transcript_1229/m.3424 type:complete len:216 (-) Transcript_1229:310-957(-)
MLTCTRPPGSVNLSALETALFAHWSNRLKSPMCRVPSVSGPEAAGSTTMSTPFSWARLPKVSMMLSRIVARRKGARTRFRWPESIRSKSSTSVRIDMTRSEHEAMDARHRRMPSSSVTRVSFTTLTAWEIARVGLRRSCMTKRIKRERADLAASAERSCTSFSFSFCRYSSRSEAAILMLRTSACDTRCIWSRWTCAASRIATNERNMNFESCRW